MEELTGKMKYYSYYREAYGAVLDGLVGQYEIQIPSANAPLYATPDLLPDGSVNPDKVWVTKYGLKGFSPIAKGFPYNDFDDFGTARSYGFKRQHLGHDMMGQVGTPLLLWKADTWKPLAGINTGAGDLAFVALTENAITITLI